MLKILVLCTVLFFSLPAFASGLDEQEKINELLETLANSNVSLVQNGKALDGDAASKLLQDRMKQVQGITTAEDFITKAVNQPGDGNKPLMIKFSDGREIDAVQWFQSQLKDIENTEIIE